MSLFESVLSSVLLAVFMPLFFSMARDAELLRRRADSMRAELSRDSFIAGSFESAGTDFESWKAMCSSLHPEIKIKTAKLAFRDGKVLCECVWEGKRKVSVKDND